MARHSVKARRIALRLMQQLAVDGHAPTLRHSIETTAYPEKWIVTVDCDTVVLCDTPNELSFEVNGMADGYVIRNGHCFSSTSEIIDDLLGLLFN